MAGNPDPNRRSFERRFEKLEEDVRKLKLRGGPGEEIIDLDGQLTEGWFDSDVGIGAQAYREGGRVWLSGVIHIIRDVGVNPQIPFDEWPEGWAPAYLQNAFLPFDPDNSDWTAGVGFVIEFYGGVADQGGAFDLHPTYMPPGGTDGWPEDQSYFILDGVSFVHE